MVTLAAGSQILARQLHIPALIVLLPVGFAAGALTDDINPTRLFGATFQPMVSLSVAIILYDSGLSLNLRKLTGHTRRVVVRLVALGAAVTWVSAALAALWILGVSLPAALMLGAILVISGPTVVGPLLNSIRPVERVQRILTWEGSLIDPVGAILGAVVFHAVASSTHHGLGSQIVQFAASLGLGLAGGLVGTLLLLAGQRLQLDEVLGTAVQVASVVAVAAACDILRDDTGLIAAIVMGVAVGNLASFDVPARRPFFETLVQLVIGLLFISISATVTPASVRHLVLPTMGLTAVLVLVTRPLVAVLSTLRTDLTRGERGFLGWMAPRGIVAAATAAAFSGTLVTDGVAGASKILPVTFLVIVATGIAYGLTGRPVARRLGVVRAAQARPLLVGDDPWIVDMGEALNAAGLDVLMWAGTEGQRARIRTAGLELASGELLAVATGQGAELEGITTVLLLTGDDDFNALAATVLRPSLEGPVYRLGPAATDIGVIAPYSDGETLFPRELTRPALTRRWSDGAQLLIRNVSEAIPPGSDLLFVTTPEGRLECATATTRPVPKPGDTLVLLGPVAG
jgi:NhaP-type Na+/H+ or K+/H+ antiporter